MTRTKGLMVLMSALALSGCACVSQEYVDQQDAMLADRISKLDSRLTADEAKLNELAGKVDAMAADVSSAKADAANAAAMANDASRKADAAAQCCNDLTQKMKKAFELQQKK
jgi:PBP1b-binding outer membrane lipoprotein LpoB